MKEITLPVSIGVDVCIHEDRVVVTRQSGFVLVVESFDLELKDHRNILTLDLPEGNAGARVESHGGILWLAYRDASDRGVLTRLDNGEAMELGPVFGQRPFAFGDGHFAWLAGPLIAYRFPLGEPHLKSVDAFPDSVATGLSHVEVHDGLVEVVTWEQMRALKPYAAGFTEAPPFLMGEDFDNQGLRGEVAGTAGRFHIWPGKATGQPPSPLHDPRMAVKACAAYVVAWASGNRPAWLGRITKQDLETAAPQPKPDEPKPTPEPVPMSIPNRFDIVEQVDREHPHLIQQNSRETITEFMWRVGAALHAADPGFGFVGKSAGENHIVIDGQRVSVDAFTYRRGDVTVDRVVDILKSAGDGPGHGGIMWNEDGRRPSNEWVQPTPFPGTKPPPKPDPDPEPPPDTALAMLQRIMADVAEIRSHFR